MMMKKNCIKVISLSAACGLFFIAGCGVKSMPKPFIAPEVVYCFDTVGHVPGAAPFIQGGTCCCTPSVEVLADYQSNDYYSEDFTVEDLINEYKRAGIITALDLEHSNNYDAYGPHVVFGGKSMVPPTPGTQNYEDVIFGKKTVFKIKRNSLRRIKDEE
jgi:hypothetical protein